MEMDAAISPCKKYRWWLWRRWSDKPPVMWIMMNPSTADHTKNDPTIHKITRYSRRWGHGAALILNIYAYRTSKQENLPPIKEAIGYRNNWWLATMMRYAERKSIPIVCAWGVKHADRGDQVRAEAILVGIDLKCLEIAKNGEPKHPRFLAESLNPIRMM